MSSVVTDAQPRRTAIFDGIRGVAIVLVVLSHGWILWPLEELTTHVVTAALFQSGNYAVSVFFVVGAFVATRGLLRVIDTPGGLRPGVALARRYLRLSGQLYFLLLAVLALSVFDLADSTPDRVTRSSLLHIATYTWNWYLQGHSAAARSDLGHLWYLSVDLQVFVLILSLVYLLRRHRGWLVVALAVVLLVVIVWRSNVAGTELLYQSLLRTTVRMDAPIAGALAAAALPYLTGLVPWARRIAALSLFSLVPLLHFNVDNDAYFGWAGLLLDLALAGFLVGCSLTSPPPVVMRTLGGRVLSYLGRESLAIYLWHFPVFFFIARHTTDWRWQARTIVGLLLVAVLVTISNVLVERRVRAALAAPFWRELSGGVPAYLRERRRSRSMRVSTRDTRSSETPSRRFTRS